MWWLRYVTWDSTVPAAGYGGRFWRIVDFNWTVEEQNELARVWKRLGDARS